jgi:flavin reductase (DIM6/NTAB) family NADH-FMN oxidoreductase RutF
MKDLATRGMLTLTGDEPIWHRFFLVAPLFFVGTREPDGTFNLAPVHHAMPLGWSANFIGFATARSHATLRNLERERVFTLSAPTPDQLVELSLAAAPRAEGGEKPSLSALSTIPATQVDGVLVEGGYLHLECDLDRVLEGFGENCLVIGKVRVAHVEESAVRRADLDDGDLLAGSPLLAFLSPGRYAQVAETFTFPFHEGFSR